MMKHDWMIDISVDGKCESEQIYLCSGDSGALLNHCDESDAIVYVEKDEIFIERVGESPVEIERYGRKRLINREHPTRILTNDTIRVGAAEYHVRGIYRMEQPQRPTSYFDMFASKVLLTSAAAIMLAVMPACKPAEPEKTVLTEPPKCENGDVKLMMCLNNNRYEKCGDGRWELVEECKKPSQCSSDWQVIDQKSYVTSTQCDNPEPCKNGSYACFADNTKCEDKKPGFNCRGEDEIYKCEDNQWKLQEKCAPEYGCEISEGFIRTEAKCVHLFTMGVADSGEDVEDVDCKYGELKCDSDDAVMRCEYGRWNYKEICKKDEICRSDSPTDAVCVPKAVGKPAFILDNEREAEPAPTEDANEVEGENPVPVVDEAPKCENGKTKCSDDKRGEIHICDNNEWKPYIQCYGNFRCKQLKPEDAAVCDFPRVQGTIVGDFKPKCTFGRTKCDSDNVIKDCMMSNWSPREKCLEPYVCKQVSRYKAICEKPEKPEE